MASFRQFWDLLSLHMRDDIRDQVDVHQVIRPAHIIRSVQLITHTWFSSRRSNGTPPIPNFADILLRIQMASYQLPALPGIYHDLTYSLKPVPPAHSTPQASLASTDVSSDLSTLSGSHRSGQPLPSTGTHSRPPPSASRNTFVRNMDPDTALQAIIPAHLQLRTVIKNDTVPNNDNNLPMCLSYHLRRGCWSQCKRAHDHNRTLSARERHRVITFVTAQLAKLSSGLPSAVTITGPPSGPPASGSGPLATATSLAGTTAPSSRG
jgi:hypothetical protein